MTAPTTTAPAADPAAAPTTGTGTGDNAGGEGLAPSTTSTTAGTAKPPREEKVRTASRDDDAPQDGTGSTTSDTGRSRARDGHDDDHSADAARKGDDAASSKPGKDWKVEDLPPGAQKYIAELRKENGTRRTEAGDLKKQAAEALKRAQAGDDRFAKATEAFMSALGLTPEPDEPERSPEERLEDITTKHRQTRIELAVYRAAGANGADPEALLDSRAFLNRAFALDPAGEEFDKGVAEAIADAVEQNPKLRAAEPERHYEPPSAPSGGDFGGGPAEPAGPDEWSVDDFRRERRNGRG